MMISLPILKSSHDGTVNLLLYTVNKEEQSFKGKLIVNLSHKSRIWISSPRLRVMFHIMNLTSFSSFPFK
jgi:hypothetical protein